MRVGEPQVEDKIDPESAKIGLRDPGRPTLVDLGGLWSIRKDPARFWGGSGGSPGDSGKGPGRFPPNWIPGAPASPGTGGRRKIIHLFRFFPRSILDRFLRSFWSVFRIFLDIFLEKPIKTCSRARSTKITNLLFFRLAPASCDFASCFSMF